MSGSASLLETGRLLSGSAAAVMATADHRGSTNVEASTVAITIVMMRAACPRRSQSTEVRTKKATAIPMIAFRRIELKVHEEDQQSSEGGRFERRRDGRRRAREQRQSGHDHQDQHDVCSKEPIAVVPQEDREWRHQDEEWRDRSAQCLARPGVPM